MYKVQKDQVYVDSEPQKAQLYGGVLNWIRKPMSELLTEAAMYEVVQPGHNRIHSEISAGNRLMLITFEKASGALESKSYFLSR